MKFKCCDVAPWTSSGKIRQRLPKWVNACSYGPVFTTRSSDGFLSATFKSDNQGPPRASDGPSAMCKAVHMCKTICMIKICDVAQHASMCETICMVNAWDMVHIAKMWRESHVLRRGPYMTLRRKVIRHNESGENGLGNVHMALWWQRVRLHGQSDATFQNLSPRTTYRLRCARHFTRAIRVAWPRRNDVIHMIKSICKMWFTWMVITWRTKRDSWFIHGPWGQCAPMWPLWTSKCQVWWQWSEWSQSCS